MGARGAAFAAFGLGEDDTHLSSIDPDGISVLAIQALDARTQTLDARTEALAKENAALKSELVALRKAIERLTRR